MASDSISPIFNMVQQVLINESGIKPPSLGGFDLLKPVQWALRPEDLQKQSNVAKYLATHLVEPDAIIR
jgi:hypothetical protein